MKNEFLCKVEFSIVLLFDVLKFVIGLAIGASIVFYFLGLHNEIFIEVICGMVILITMIIILLYVILDRVTKNSRKRITWTSYCSSRCEERELIFGHHNSVNAQWRCTRCGAIYSRDSEKGFSQNKRTASNTYTQ
ncbi:MAG: hypothetical protein WCV55_00105 [Candidatus Paceibacterota bacterium]